jgi:L-fuconolactonase
VSGTAIDPADVDPTAVEDVVDAHVHVWHPDRADYPWLAEVPRLARSFDLGDVAAEQRAAGVSRVVLVQAGDNVEDTENMLRTARLHRQVAGVVGWVPIDDASAAASVLDRWQGEPIVGVRHLVHRDPNPDLLLAPEVDDVLGLLAERDLTFDVCAESLHLLALVPSLAGRHPNLTLVVDHLAKPPIREGGWEPWAGLLAEAAEAPNVVTKLSGLNTAAAPGATADDYRPYVEHALTVFGAGRVLYGGDWPFALLAADSYTEIWQGLRGCLDLIEPDARRDVLANTACRVYRLRP